MKKLAFLLSLVSVFIFVNPALAKPDSVNQQLDSNGTSKTLVLPPAANNSPIISLGTAIDPQTGKIVEGIAIVHPKKAYNHKPNHNKARGGNNSAESSCFAFLAKGAYWKTTESWKVNTTNSEGLSNNFIFNNLTANISKWNNAAGVDILGSGATTNSILEADTVSPDGVNEVYFADVSGSNSIAVTIVWGIFSGPPFGREIIEWDQVYDDTDFGWSSTGEAGKMDFENISTHEIGHSTGMGHPDDSCSEETMYRFATEGETQKRDLNSGDISGISDLYN